MHRPLLCVILILAHLAAEADSVVHFSNAALYDQIDLEHEELNLTCSEGCYLYASIPRQDYKFFDQIFVLNRNTNIRMENITSIARKFDSATQTKIPLLLTPGSEYAIVNTNRSNPSTSCAVYVISKKLLDDNDAPKPVVYEPQMAQKGSHTASRITLLSSDPFTMSHVNIDRPGQVRMYFTGPDIILNDDEKLCFPLYYLFSDNHGHNFLLPVRSPILTMASPEVHTFEWTLMEGILDGRHIFTDGLNTALTSMGFTGCASQEMFHWRNRGYHINETYRMMTDEYFNVTQISTCNTRNEVFTLTEKGNYTFHTWMQGIPISEISLQGHWFKVEFNGFDGDTFGMRLHSAQLPEPGTTWTPTSPPTQSASDAPSPSLYTESSTKGASAFSMMISVLMLTMLVFA